MPSPPSVPSSSSIRMPSLHPADLPSKQRCTTALTADHAHESCLSQNSGDFQAGEGLPAATTACLRVLHKILSGAAAAAGGADVARSQNNAEGGIPPERRDTTCYSETIHTTESVACSHTGQSMRSIHDGMETDNAFVAAKEGAPSEESCSVHDASSVRSFVYAFELLHAAEELDTLSKCFHMLHAVCILADQRNSYITIGTPKTPSPPDVFISSPKRRKISVEGCAMGEAIENPVQQTAGDNVPGSTRSIPTNAAGAWDQGHTRCQVTAAPFSTESRIKHEGTAAEDVISIKAHSSAPFKADAELLPTLCDQNKRAQIQCFPATRHDFMHFPLHRHSRTSEVAGLLLGYIEALEAPPSLSDPKFHEKILHVLCRVLYTRQPLKVDFSTIPEASALTAAMRSDGGNTSAAFDGSGINSQKVADSNNATAAQLLEVHSEGEHEGCFATNEAFAMRLRPSPQEWRQHIVIRFGLVERLLLCSVPALFMKDAPRAQTYETSGTVATDLAAEDGDVSVETSECANRYLFADFVSLDASATDDAAGRDEAAETNDAGKRDRPARSASGAAASPPALIYGRERCRRALRTVRRWVAFLLELEHERQALCERVLQASEEVQGLPHMLLQGRRQQEQAQQPSSSYEGQARLSAAISKSRSLLSLGIPSEDTAMIDIPKSRSPKEAATNGGAPEEAPEELELRIRATQQVLALPSLPPFTCLKHETVRTARSRFERCLLRWREAQERRRQQEEEARKKSAAAAAAVAYVTERMQEQQQAQAVVCSASPGTAAATTALLRLRSISHAFYLLGLNPQTATFQMVLTECSISGSRKYPTFFKKVCVMNVLGCLTSVVEHTVGQELAREVEEVRKKWRVLLHPDKFVSTHPDLLQQATEAFKAAGYRSMSLRHAANGVTVSFASHPSIIAHERHCHQTFPRRERVVCGQFHVAVTEANRLLSQRRVEPSWSPPPPPPELTTAMCSSTAVAASEPGVAGARLQDNFGSRQTPGKTSVGTAATAAAATAAASSYEKNAGGETHTSCCPVPTHQFSPAVTVQVSRSKKKACVGALTVQVHGAPSREGEWPFAIIKEIRIFVLRPTLPEGPPWKLVPAPTDVCLHITKAVELTCTCPAATRECNASSSLEDLSGACPGVTVEIDALQPVELGVEKVYWVGVQVEGLHSSQSLVTWNPIAVCLALPNDGEKDTSPHVGDRKKQPTFEGQAGGNDANANCGTSAADRALLAFLQTFAAAAFTRTDCSFNSRLQDAIASLKRTLRRRKKSKKSQQAAEHGQEVEECQWVRDEAKHVLLECIEKGRKWGSEVDKRTTSSAMG